jgi:serine/threonine protein kinase
VVDVVNGIAAADCPAVDELLAFSHGTLPPEAGDRIVLHLEHCNNCTQLLETLHECPDAILLDLRQPVPLEAFTDGATGTVAKVLNSIDFRALRSSAAAPPEQLGDYRLVKKLGQGGMGTVYQALHILLNKTVAIKVLSEHRLGKPRALARFRREMQAIGSLDHPNIVLATDAREENGVHFLVMEYVAGIDLAELVRRRGPLPVAIACAIISQACKGLEYAYAKGGLVHRDLKPANLMLTHDGCVKVLDLGLARWIADEQPDLGGEPLSGVDELMGTADYMAPEQWLSSNVDIRADIYSLGCTLYYLLTGQPPYGTAEYDSSGKKMLAHTRTPMPPIRQRRPDVPESLARVLSQMMAKEPAQRPARPAQVVELLAPLAAGAELTALVRNTPASADPRLPPLGSASLPWSKRRTVLVGLLAILLPTLAAAFTLWFLPTTSSTPANGSSIPLAIRLRIQRLEETAGQFFSYELGQDEFSACFDDKVQVYVDFSEPAYAFLLAFNPNGKEQLCIPNLQEQVPERRNKLDYPSADAAFKLNDGVGLQVFAVIASRQPFPAYAEWESHRPALRWLHLPAKEGVIWRGDGERLEPVLRSSDERGEVVPLTEQAPLRALLQSLRAAPGVEALAAEAFPVLHKQGGK